MQLLVYKSDMAWPRRSGHDVHTFEMMRCWAASGHAVHLATAIPPLKRAIEGIGIKSMTCLREYARSQRSSPIANKGLARRYARYWGIPDADIRSVGQIASEISADAVIASGLDSLPLLSSVSKSIRIWYAADEWLWHHLSLMHWRDLSTWRELKIGLVKGLYEWSHRGLLDRIWVVSETDKRAMRMVSGVQNVDIISNGVDVEYFKPYQTGNEKPCSAIFWGRLDFDPNIQALNWFSTNVWPLLSKNHPQALFTIIGAHPDKRVLKLESKPGILVLGDVDDLRPLAARHQLVVLPFVSGGGIKNKLLEAAALGKPIVCSPVGAGGLRGSPPLCVCRTPAEWLTTIESIWEQPDQRNALGSAARDWVCLEHTWAQSAQAALKTIIASRVKLTPGLN